jgi:GDPmannose 4,6-dehydratase
MSKIALICGVSGQDGALLAQVLLANGYVVWGTSRDAQGKKLYQCRKCRNQSSVTTGTGKHFFGLLSLGKKVERDRIYSAACA